jgi:hypothetical protein
MAMVVHHSSYTVLTRDARNRGDLFAREWQLMLELAACRAELRRLTAVVDAQAGRLAAVDAARLRAVRAGDGGAVR